MRILAVIPARGGSKRIPKKNLKKLGGKPLIAWTIEAARKSKLITDIIVSTEDEHIADVSRRFGVEVLPRPKHLATDWAKTIDVILRAIRGIEYEIVVCLQPTSPFRNETDIDNAISMFLKRNCDSVISVCETSQEISWFLRTEKQYLVPVAGHKYLDTRSQRLPQVFIPNGAIYISRPDVLFKYKTFYTNKTVPFIMPPNRSIDIDDMDDWVIAEATIKK